MRLILVNLLSLGCGCATAGCAAPAVPASPPPRETSSAPTTRAVLLAPGLSIDRESREVRVQGRVALREGFLEQLVCFRGTREHESLVVVDVPASSIHAALLAVNANPGHPGRWSIRPGTAKDLKLEPPVGDRVLLEVRYSDHGTPRRLKLGEWVEDSRHRDTFDPDAFVFAGSRFEPDGHGGQRYTADVTGSIVGLVTFGDELIGCARVIPDLAEVDEPHWKARTRAMPPEDTPVEIIIRAAGP